MVFILHFLAGQSKARWASVYIVFSLALNFYLPVTVLVAACSDLNSSLFWAYKVFFCIHFGFFGFVFYEFLMCQDEAYLIA